jgi:hypothetical protein
VGATIDAIRVDVVHRGGSSYRRRARSTALERGEHGRLACYRSGCRCAGCVATFCAYHRARYARLQLARAGESNRRVALVAVARHVRRLRAVGWSIGKIAAEAGCSSSTVRRYARLGRRGRGWSTFADAICGIAAAAPDDDRDLGAELRARLEARGYRTLVETRRRPPTPA